MSNTRDTIMEAATAIVQAQGYNGLTFRELAKQVGIKSASIHHYFPTKADLGAALARRYREAANTALDALAESSPDPATCLRTYAMGFRIALDNGNRMCLCGLLGAEYDELPEPVRVEVNAFIDDNVDWLAAVLAPLSPAPQENLHHQALAIYAAISGAQLTARSRADASVFDTVVEGYLAAGLIPG